MQRHTISHQNYQAEVRFDASAGCYHGRVVGIPDTIDFFGSSEAELKREFRNSIEIYLA